MTTGKKLGPHDLGGDPAEAVPREEHELAFWEKRIDALYKLLADDKRQLVKVDELRFAIESLGDDAYSRYGYYERWTLAINKLLIEKGVLDARAIEARIADIRERAS